MGIVVIYVAAVGILSALDAGGGILIQGLYI